MESHDSRRQPVTTLADLFVRLFDECRHRPATASTMASLLSRQYRDLKKAPMPKADKSATIPSGRVAAPRPKPSANPPAAAQRKGNRRRSYLSQGPIPPEAFTMSPRLLKNGPAKAIPADLPSGTYTVTPGKDGILRFTPCD